MKTWLNKINDNLDWRYFSIWVIFANIVAISKAPTFLDYILYFLLANGLMFFLAVMAYYNSNKEEVTKHKEPEVKVTYPYTISSTEVNIDNYVTHNKLGRIKVKGIFLHCETYAVSYGSDKKIEGWVYLHNCKGLEKGVS